VWQSDPFEALGHVKWTLDLGTGTVTVPSYTPGGSGTTLSTTVHYRK